MSAKPKYSPVAIEWKDSSSIQNGWIESGNLDALGVSECLSVGFILSEDKEKVVICANISNANQSNPLVNGCMVILKKQITKRYNL